MQLGQLTSWNNHPDEVHKEVIEPEVVRLGSAIDQAEEVFVERISRIVENVAVNLAEGDDQLQGLTEGVLDGDIVGDEERKRSPAHLNNQISKSSDNLEPIVDQSACNVLP